MSLTEIIFRLFAWVRPLLWYYHRAGNLLEAFLISLERARLVESLVDNPEHRARWEGMMADCEHVLDIAIGLRARELLGRPVEPETRPGLQQQRIRIHTPPSFEALAGRLLRLIARHADLERLARLRAARIRREIEAAPVVLVADHRSQDIQPSWMMIVVSSLSPASSHAFAIPAAGLRIRAPPWLSPHSQNSPLLHLPALLARPSSHARITAVSAHGRTAPLFP